MGNQNTEAPKVKDGAHLSNWSSVQLFNDSRIVDEPTFTADGSWKGLNGFNVSKKIKLVGLGFLGPPDSDASYEVRVEPKCIINGHWFSYGFFKKRILAKQNEVFYFFFDKPIVVQPLVTKAHYTFDLNYSLKGPDTASVEIGPDNYLESKNSSDGVDFFCQWSSKQLVELLFNKV